MSVTIPQFSLPPRRVDGIVAVNEQDTADEIRDCVQAIVRFPLGYRIERPDFGLPEQEFQEQAPDAVLIEAIIERWEPRAEALTSTELVDLVAAVRIESRGGNG